ncbi:MAG TPA: DUF378 domain-containing protein [Myxococcaceae bacterium]|nr:DUF378 domain-containing protein [Myxococcaceae bacterium]
MDRYTTLSKVILAVAIIGAINWGLVGFFNFNLVDAVLGGGSREETSGGSRFVYALVGLAGLASAFLLPGRRHAGTHDRAHIGDRSAVRP